MHTASHRSYWKGMTDALMGKNQAAGRNSCRTTSVLLKSFHLGTVTAFPHPPFCLTPYFFLIKTTQQSTDKFMVNSHF